MHFDILMNNFILNLIFYYDKKENINFHFNELQKYSYNIFKTKYWSKTRNI